MLTKPFFKWISFVLGILIIDGCLTPKPTIDKSKLVGHWLTTKPETTSNIIIERNGKFLDLLEDTTAVDTLRFTFELKGDIMTIFVKEGMWASKNKILALTTDSLVYERKGDKKVFRYVRHGK